MATLLLIAVVVGMASTLVKGFGAGPLAKPSLTSYRTPCARKIGLGERAMVNNQLGAAALTGRWERDAVKMMAVLDRSSDGTAFDNDSFKKGFVSADAEDQYLMEPSMGSIPKDIEGTLYRNGPGKMKIGNDLVKHPFDGDGMVLAVSFSKEGAYFRNRYVKTKGYLKELEAGKQLYRGMSDIPGGFLKNAFRIARKNLANTNVIMWGGNLLALWEGGLPHRLDAKSLETLGETKLGETIDEKRPIFSAHPRIDTKGGRLVGFGSHNMQETTLYEYDEDFKLRSFRVLKDVKGFIHDFVLTEKYAIFFSPPIALNPLLWVLGLKDMGRSIAWKGDKRGSLIHIVPRDPSKPTKSIPVPAKFSYHMANAYDDPKTGYVVIDTMEYDRLVLSGQGDPNLPVWETSDWAKDASVSAAVRYRVDVSSDEGTVVDTRTLYDLQLEFPSVNPKVYCQEHRYIFAQCGAPEDKVPCPGQGVIKVDTVDGTVDKWLPEPHEFAGESTFIPRKGAPDNAPEDYGYLATVVVNGRDHKAEIVILDAQKVSQGPVCRLPLKGFIPHMIHGSFVPHAVFTPQQVEKSFSLTNLFDRKGWNVANSQFSGLVHRQQFLVGDWEFRQWFLRNAFHLRIEFNHGLNGRAGVEGDTHEGHDSGGGQLMA